MGGSRLPSGGRDHLRVRVATAWVLTAATLALIATEPWHRDRPTRPVLVTLALVAVLALHLATVLRLTGYRARVAPSTLVAAAGSAGVVTAIWILPRLSGFPVEAAGALVLVEAGGLIAAGVTGVRTLDAGQALLACLWSTALGSFLVFAGSLVAFAVVPDSVPDAQGRLMLSLEATAPDGYLALLALTCALAVVVCVVVPTTPRSAGPVPRGLGSRRT
jgi:hypothetical protein